MNIVEGAAFRSYKTVYLMFVRTHKRYKANRAYDSETHRDFNDIEHLGKLFDLLAC